MTRDQLLRRLEARLTDALEQFGISATVVSVPSEAGSLPVALQGVPDDRLSDEVLEAVESTVRDFVEAHEYEFATLLSQPTDPKLLN